MKFSVCTGGWWCSADFSSSHFFGCRSWHWDCLEGKMFFSLQEMCVCCFHIFLLLVTTFWICWRVWSFGCRVYMQIDGGAIDNTWNFLCWMMCCSGAWAIVAASSHSRDCDAASTAAAGISLSQPGMAFGSSIFSARWHSAGTCIHQPYLTWQLTKQREECCKKTCCF